MADIATALGEPFDVVELVIRNNPAERAVRERRRKAYQKRLKEDARWKRELGEQTPPRALKKTESLSDLSDKPLLRRSRKVIAYEAFKFIVPRWQEAQHRTGNGLDVLCYHKEIGAGQATYTRCSSVVRPCISDFIADVELQVRRALLPDELSYFMAHYREGRLDAVQEELKELDNRIRLKVGRRFSLTSKWAIIDDKEVRIYRGVDLYVPAEEARCIAEVNPLGRYMAAVDVHQPPKAQTLAEVIPISPRGSQSLRRAA